MEHDERNITILWILDTMITIFPELNIERNDVYDYSDEELLAITAVLEDCCDKV